MGEYHKGEREAQLALDQARKLADAKKEAEILNMLASYLGELMGDYHQALEHYAGFIKSPSS